MLENTAPSYDKPYSYIIPEHLLGYNLVGARVRVPFGRGNKLRTGLVLSVNNGEVSANMKKIEELMDNPPLLNKEGLLLIRYLKEHTFCSWFDAVRLLIPTGLGFKKKYSYYMGEAPPRSFTGDELEILNYLSKKKSPISEETLFKKLTIKEDSPQLLSLLSSGHVVQSAKIRQNILDDKIAMVRLIDDSYTKATGGQIEVIDFLRSESPVSLKEASYYTGASRSVFKTLEKRGVVEFFEEVKPRGAYVHADVENTKKISLSSEQNGVYKSLKAKLDGYNTSLLYGVTGSGKTQVFLKLTEDVIEAGKSVIIMVPEISLTSQTILSLQARFGNKVAVLHSGLSLGERTDEWKRIESGQAPIAVGTRSAVFAPLKNIGMIVIDEEQEHTYKSDRSPRFHARNVARFRMQYNNGLLLLCSATPSVESYYYGDKGVYDLYSLKSRFGTATLPDVRVIDMQESQFSNSINISSELLDEIYYNLEHKEQTILLLNRRGYSTVIKCSSCGTTAECPNCSVSLTYHTANDNLVCHYCGFMEKRNTNCKTCDSEFIRYVGIGTQKLEEELLALLPDAKILRMDLDTTMSKNAHSNMLEAFRNQEYDILIGTQMVAKGLNFPKVTLVGVISIDHALYANNFRSYERAFSLITQVVGRSGRFSTPGRALIQTYTPDHPIVELAAKQDYPMFYKGEIATRKLNLYPPFCTIAGIGFVSESAKEAEIWADKFSSKLKSLAKKEYAGLPLRILGPSQNEIYKIAGKYRHKLLVKCRNDEKTRIFLMEMLNWFYDNCKEVSIFIDMHYEQM